MRRPHPKMLAFFPLARLPLITARPSEDYTPDFARTSAKVVRFFGIRGSTPATTLHEQKERIPQAISIAKA